MSRFLKSSLRSLRAYTPGEQPRDKKYIKLNTNESPFPPSQGVINAADENSIKDLRLYCDPEAKDLRTAIAMSFDKKPENIFVSNGSDDILNFAFMAFAEQGAVFPDITYGFYKVFAELYGIETEIIPLKKDFTIDTEPFMVSKKMAVIANPNAPTGIYMPAEIIESIVRSDMDRLVLVDEAYIDFGGQSCIFLTEKYPNLLVCRTFSKSRSMAGARLGFAVGNEEIIKDLEKIKYSTNPYSVNTLTQLCGTAAMKDDDYYRNNCRKIIKNREYTVSELLKAGFQVLPSEANFIFARSGDISGADLYAELRKRGILVRHFDDKRIKDFIRITIGSEEQMKTFTDTVKEIEGEKNEKR